MKPILRAFIDVETTGLDHKIHTIHQIACIITDPDGNQIDSIELSFAPRPGEVSFEALNKCRLTYEQLHSRPLTNSDAFKRFISFLENHVNKYEPTDKLHFVAYNSNFDEDFIRDWFILNKNDYFNSYFWSPSLCMQKTAAWYLSEHRTQIKSFKLMNVCEFLGISTDENEAHDAMYDILKTVELYQKLNL